MLKSQAKLIMKYGYLLWNLTKMFNLKVTINFEK